MPFVNIHNWGLPSKLMECLSDQLPQVVAEALHIESVADAHLTAADIEVKVVEPGRYDKHGDYDFGVNVEAKRFDERVLRLPLAKLWIKKKVLEIAKGYRGYVWVTLPEADFAEIMPDETAEEVQVELPAA